MRIAVVVALVICVAPSLSAEEPDAVARARLNFETGRLLYKQGDYEAAARQFNAGYVLVPRPQFLLNSGLCYQKMEQLDKARALYERYLREAPPDEPDRERVSKWLAEVDAKLGAQKGNDQQRRQVDPGVTPSISGQPASNMELTAAPPRKSFARKNWWVFPVAGVVAAGVVVGIVLGVRASGPSCAGNPSCIDLR
jgi:Tfp pilus assembly protein PilF